MIPLHFRDASESDLNKIVEIYNSTIPSRMVTADTDFVSVESKQKWFFDHNPQKRPLWIVENQDKDTLAWVSFQSFYGRPAYDATVEISIYIDSNYRGKGLGKQILEYALQKAPDYGFKTVLGFVFAHNEPSLKLFYHFGFEDWGNLPKVAQLDGREIDLKILGKRI